MALHLNISERVRYVVTLILELDICDFILSDIMWLFYEALSLGSTISAF